MMGVMTDEHALDPDPLMDKVSGHIVAALTYSATGDPAHAVLELQILKDSEPEGTIDWLFGAYAEALVQVALAYEKDVLEVIRIVGAQAALVSMGIDPNSQSKEK